MTSRGVSRPCGRGFGDHAHGTIAVVRRRFAPALLVAFAAAACARTTTPAAARHPGAPIILISIDTLRADHLSAYGYQRGSTPVLDRLSREGIVFEQAYSAVPLTLPSHATLLTGRQPMHHGVRDNIGYTLAPGERTLASRLKAAGYATGGAISAYVLRRQTGISAGFDAFDDALTIAGTGESLAESRRDGAATVDALAAWLDAQGSDRVFAFLHLYEPHAPYTPPPSHAMPLPYDGEIAYADELVGRFLGRASARGLLDRAIVAVVSDHGEGLGDHGEAEHGLLLYREALHVPAILRLPGGAQGGRRVAGAVGLVDIAPTLLDLAGIAADGMDGAPLTSAIASGRADDRTVYSETLYPRLHFGWSDLASAVDGRYHYIQAPRPELYDLTADAAERTNLAPARASTAAALASWIGRATAGTTVALPGAADAEARERLRALGYATSSPPPATPANLQPDPKDKIGAYEAVRHAQQLAAEGRDREVIDTLRTVLASNGDMLDGWELTAKSLLKIGRTRDAIDAFGRVLAIDPAKPETHLALARIFALERDTPRARAHAELAAGRDPAGAYEILAELMMDAGKPDDAAAFARRSLEADPSRYVAEFVLGVVAQRSGRCGDAIPAFERALDAKRREPAAVVRNLHAGLADCLARAGRPADAEREFRAELADVPWSPEARVGLATLYRSQGKDAEARTVLGGLVAAQPAPTADAYYTVVHALTVLGDTAAAREWSAKARAKFPSDPRFR
jgi:arylsulfatase A-like enzyme/Tfp pilus assembly protein PilF